MYGEETDYYKILEIPRTASIEEIRKSYRRLAVIYHPDKNPEGQREAAAEKFKLIAAAYEVLSDEKKRAEYDRYGSVGSGSGRPYGGGDSRYDYQHAQDIFDMFFRDFGGGSSLFGDSFFNRRDRTRSGGDGRRGRSHSGFPSSFMDDDDDTFFGGRGFGSFGSFDRMFEDFHSSAFSSGSGNLRDGVSKSISTSTRIVNGKQVTKTTTTIRHADGTVESSTKEETSMVPPSGKRYIDIGGGVGGGSGRYLDSGSGSDKGGSLTRKTSSPAPSAISRSSHSSRK